MKASAMLSSSSGPISWDEHATYKTRRYRLTATEAVYLPTLDYDMLEVGKNLCGVVRIYSRKFSHASLAASKHL